MYVASECPASELAVALAEGAGREVMLVTIPVDDGPLARRACRHTVGVLMEESVVWAPLAVLPEELVCSRMILDGAGWMRRSGYFEWPVFVSRDGEVHLGADAAGLRTVGITVSDEEHERMVEQWASTSGFTLLVGRGDDRFVESIRVR